MTNQRLPKDITNTPAPYLPGLYSIQAVSATAGLPDVTVYRMTVEAALAWKDASVARRIFSKFLLRHAPDAWDVYDADGKLDCLCSDVVGRRLTDQPASALASREQLEAEASSAIGRPTAHIIHAEGHAAAAVADHSNYGHILRSMIRDADARDLEHLYVVESHSRPYRVAGIYADVSALSVDAQNLFLDAHRALTRRLPLDTEDYVRLFVNRVASLRVDYLRDICVSAGISRGLDEDEILSIRLTIGCRGVEFRRGLTSELLRLSGGRPVASARGEAEELNTTVLNQFSEDVVAALCVV